MARKLAAMTPPLQRLAARVGTLSTAGAGFLRQDGRSSAARGYGADWRKLRAIILTREPLCRACAERGLTVPATDVDHIEPFSGLADPRRLAPGNCRPLCRPCHARRSQRQAVGADR
jgi:5-methylcytosine-specific restriction endonuclease McrA